MAVTTVGFGVYSLLFRTVRSFHLSGETHLFCNLPVFGLLNLSTSNPCYGYRTITNLLL